MRKRTASRRFPLGERFTQCFALIATMLPLLVRIPAAAAQQPMPPEMGLPAVPEFQGRMRAAEPAGEAPASAALEQAKSTALAYLRCMAGGTLPEPKACSAFIHPDAVWPRGEPYSILLVSPDIRVVDVGVVPKTINPWRPDVEFVVTVEVETAVIGRVSQLLDVRRRVGTARRTLDLIESEGRFRVIDLSRPLVRWAFPESAAAWAGEMQGRNPKYREVRMRIEALAGDAVGTVPSAPSVP